MAGLGSVMAAVVDVRLGGRESARATDEAERRERAYEASLRADLSAEWILPRGEPEQNLRTDRIESMADVNTPIGAGNKGYQMLLRMGWGGGGLGPKKSGITEPVRGGVDRWDRAGGVGRQEQDEDMTNEQNIERRKLAVEVEETDVDREKRETTHAKETRIKEEVKQMTSVFKCELCNKQYKTVKEHEQHLSSYDHHHKKRLIEMKESMRESRSDIQKREERRAEKEMARYNDLCAAQGQQAASTAATPLATALPDAEARAVVKLGFGFSAGRGSKAGGKRKPKLQPSVFQTEDSDE